ncbi:hypothetical protein [Comamonas antarctica]|uniref:Uncharacterized protein n=1 Tax=Comamonas antarctica TaxID=2743470 RepID=A0A6N1X7S8_9BURK|nr:hypothetical protein [Comamonas antarctica]QKV55449.1 hypothetical protein HUK68_21255 [Comamonas antarctica]
MTSWRPGGPAARLHGNLAGAANIEVICADGAAQPEFPVDAIYVNFGVARPAERWLHHLKPGGRLVLPLGVPQMHATLPVRVIEQGMGLMITREHAGFAARSLGAKPFVFAQGAAELPDADMDTLRRSLETGHDQRIRSLVSRQAARAPAWFAGKD